MRARGLRIVLVGWALLLVATCAAAGAMRVWHHSLRRQAIVNYLAPVGDEGVQDVEAYIWGYSLGPGRWDFQGSPQGEAIYLLEHGFASPALERSLLLCEARRCYDWKYLYQRVNNYDLRTRLSERCLKNFPDDALVHWAVGQLSLAAGDFEQAERELERTLHLAGEEPGGVRQFCLSAGISEEHLRGRYACALTLLGNWTAADEQAALAKTAGDGVRAPELTDWDADWNREHYPEAYRVERSRAAQAERCVQNYLRTRNPAELAPLLTQLQHQRAAAANIGSTGNYDAEDTGEAEQRALLRAYLLTHEWDKVPAYLGPNDHDYPGEADLRDATGYLLTRLAAGRPLGMTAVQSRAARFRQMQAESGKGTAESSWKWELAYADHGELAGLLEADYLPFLLRTDGFADALRHSGRRRNDVLAEVRRVVQPQRDNYYDYGPGKLDWR